MDDNTVSNSRLEKVELCVAARCHVDLTHRPTGSLSKLGGRKSQRGGEEHEGVLEEARRRKKPDSTIDSVELGHVVVACWAAFGGDGNGTKN
uniref:Uncharacterized protein n=1 Tax=Oryza nivara TaxID=4536 RepID=A0A0E0FZV6_ORYNI